MHSVFLFDLTAKSAFVILLQQKVIPSFYAKNRIFSFDFIFLYNAMYYALKCDEVDLFVSHSFDDDWYSTF